MLKTNLVPQNSIPNENATQKPYCLGFPENFLLIIWELHMVYFESIYIWHILISSNFLQIYPQLPTNSLWYCSNTLESGTSPRMWSSSEEPHLYRKLTLFSPTYHMAVASWLEVELHAPFSTPCWDFCLVWADLVYTVTIAVSSYVQLPCFLENTVSLQSPITSGVYNLFASLKIPEPCGEDAM